MLSKHRAWIVVVSCLVWLAHQSGVRVWADVHTVSPPTDNDSAAVPQSANDDKKDIPKNNQEENYFVHKTILIPHDDKKDRGGEDAAATSDTWLVVADGVGGWGDEGVDPGLYSRKLTQTVVQLATDKDNEDTTMMDIVDRANWMAAGEHLGSATCTTLKVSTAGPYQMETLNVGDSGYSIHRPTDGQSNDKDSSSSWTLVYASEPGQQSFNFPHQLGGKYGHQVREVGVSQTHTLQPNDIIVVYSDGVSDNLFPREFHDCLDRAKRPDNNNDKNNLTLGSFSLAADCIARTAYFLGKDETFDSPFGQGARQNGLSWQGGKHDDITVVVAQMLPRGRSDNTVVNENDPYRAESQFMYTGPVGKVEELPKLRDLLVAQAQRNDEL